MKQSLKGIKVLDLTHMLAGPYTTMILADLGAEVVKIEQPKTGDITRNLLKDDPKYSFDGIGAYHLTLGRNKKSVELDLKSEEGLKLFKELAEVADVVVDNFSQGVTKRLGIDHQSLKEVNPQIITCSISGFGDTEVNRPAYDNLIQGYAGAMSITGTDKENPVKSGIPIADLGAGLYAVIGILSAIQSREKNDLGEHVDISMLDTQVSLLTYMATMHFLSGENPEPIGNQHMNHVPFNSYKTSDGFIQIGVVAEDFWPSLIEALDLRQLDTEENKVRSGRLKNRENIDQAVQEVFITNTTEHWLKTLQEHRVPCGPINTLSETFQDADLLKRNMIVEVLQDSGVSVKMPGNPVKISNHDEEFRRSPKLGEHTSEIFKDWLNKDIKLDQD
ncbi:CoA transferase [Gammaproteobacteria bacterium]|nr:CoA transferase [Gammaproteobacteria bacterium]